MISEKIVFETEAKNADGKSYLTVKQTGHYCYTERLGVDSIAFILFDRNQRKFGLIEERKPPFDVREGKEVTMKTAFGGSLDSDKHSPLEITIEEVREEAGYKVTDDDILYLGKVIVSTQMNQYCHLYLVNVTDIEFSGRDPQTQMEADSVVVWMTKEEVMNNVDWKAITIISKTDFY
jgi:hypothetical protein